MKLIYLVFLLRLSVMISHFAPELGKNTKHEKLKFTFCLDGESSLQYQLSQGGNQQK